VAKYPELTHKRGDTFALGCTYKNSEGTAESLEGMTVTSQIRDREDVLLQALTVDLADQDEDEGQFSISATATETALWPVAKYLMDIQILNGTVVVSSETISLRIERDITHD
jgi:hypothetical protein